MEPRYQLRGHAVPTIPNRHCRCKLSTKRSKCAEETTGLIHHSDHGSQYVSVVYNERRAQHGIAASTGSVGDSYDNALAENVNGPSQERADPCSQVG